jgi:hypothetical protein
MPARASERWWVLRAIVAGQTAAIPFENLDVLAKQPVRLDLPALREKLVQARCTSWPSRYRATFGSFTTCRSGLAHGSQPKQDE